MQTREIAFDRLTLARQFWTMPRGTSCRWRALLALLVCVAGCRGKAGVRRVAPPRAPTGAARLAVRKLFYARPHALHELAECADADLRACLAPLLKPNLAPWPS